MVLDPVRGKVVDIASGGDGRPVVATADGREHVADLVVVAGEKILFFFLVKHLPAMR